MSLMFTMVSDQFQWSKWPELTPDLVLSLRICVADRKTVRLEAWPRPSMAQFSWRSSFTLTTRRNALILHHRRAHFAASSLFFCWNKLRLLLMVVVGSVLEAIRRPPLGALQAWACWILYWGLGWHARHWLVPRLVLICLLVRWYELHLITFVHLPPTSHHELPLSLATSPINHRQSWLCVMMTMTVRKGHHHRWIDTRCERRMNVV
jgi:hypothetical protein